MTTGLRFRVGGRSVVIVGMMLGVSLATLHAQQEQPRERPSRPFDRLFSPMNVARTNLATLSVHEGMDIIAADHNAPAGKAPVSGPFLGLRPSVQGSAGGSAAALRFDGTAVFRRYASVDRVTLLNGSGGAGLQLTGRRTGLKLDQSVSHTPYYEFLRLPVAMASAGFSTSADVVPDGVMQDRTVTKSLTSVDLGRQLTRGTMVATRYWIQYSHFGQPSSGVAVLQDTTTQDASARISRQFGRYLALSVGYGTRITTRPAIGAAPLRTHDINVGIDRGQQLRFSRRTTLQLFTGSSIAEVTGGHRFILTGHAFLQHDLSRNWLLTATGGRAVDYVAGLTVPVLSDAVSGGFGGRLGSRVRLTGSGGYSRGNVGLTAGSSRYNLYSGSAGMHVLFTKQLGAYGEYVVYRQRFTEAAALPMLFDNAMDRQGWRVGLMMNVPLQSTKPGQGGAR